MRFQSVNLIKLVTPVESMAAIDVPSCDTATKIIGFELTRNEAVLAPLLTSIMETKPVSSPKIRYLPLTS
jgi:hypothetical protein